MFNTPDWTSHIKHPFRVLKEDVKSNVRLKNPSNSLNKTKDFVWVCDVSNVRGVTLNMKIIRVKNLLQIN
jgi:hypothetical protein